MSVGLPPLAKMVLTATMLCPRIVREAAKAGHGTESQRRASLANAIDLTREILAQLEIAQQKLGWRDDAGDKVA